MIINHLKIRIEGAVIKLSRRETFTNSQENKPHKKQRKKSFLKIVHNKKDKNQFKFKSDIDQNKQEQRKFLIKLRHV